MRTTLSAIEQTRDRFRGVFQQYGSKSYKGHSARTLLLKNITLNGEKVTDHIWLTETEGLSKFDFYRGDIIEFCARVKKYEKGYINHRMGMSERREDFKLSHPTQITRIKEGR